MRLKTLNFLHCDSRFEDNPHQTAAAGRALPRVAHGGFVTIVESAKLQAFEETDLHTSVTPAA